MDSPNGPRDQTLHETAYRLRSRLAVARLAAELLHRNGPETPDGEKLHGYLQGALDALAHEVEALASAPEHGRPPVFTSA